MDFQLATTSTEGAYPITCTINSKQNHFLAAVCETRVFDVLISVNRVSMASTTRWNVPRYDWLLPRCDEVMQAACSDDYHCKLYEGYADSLWSLKRNRDLLYKKKKIFLLGFFKAFEVSPSGMPNSILRSKRS